MPPFESVLPCCGRAGFTADVDRLSALSPRLRVAARVGHASARVTLGLHSRTRLAGAARAGNGARCAHLVSCGADVNARDTFGRSALTEAVGAGHEGVAAWLRGAGAAEESGKGRISPER